METTNLRSVTKNPETSTSHNGEYLCLSLSIC